MSANSALQRAEADACSRAYRNTGSGSVRGQGVCPCLQNPIPLGQELCEPRAEWIGCSSSRGGVAGSGVRRLIWSLLRNSKNFHTPPLREPGWSKRGAGCQPQPARKKDACPAPACCCAAAVRGSWAGVGAWAVSGVRTQPRGVVARRGRRAGGRARFSCPPRPASTVCKVRRRTPCAP